MSDAYYHHHRIHSSSSRLWILMPEFPCLLFHLWWIKVQLISSSFSRFWSASFFFIVFFLKKSQFLLVLGCWGFWSDAMWQMNLSSDETMETGSYPERPGEPDCSYYIRTGLCRFGSTCRFNHPRDRELVWYVFCVPVCDFWFVWLDENFKAFLPSGLVFMWTSVIVQFVGYSHCEDERRIPWKDWSAWMRGKKFWFCPL